MTKTIHCEKCLKEIRIRGDLVTAISFFEVIPYHEDCYARDLKGAKTLILSNQPINSISGNFISLMAIAILIVSLFVREETMWFISIISIIPIVYRAYSFFVFERYLEK